MSLTNFAPLLTEMMFSDMPHFEFPSHSFRLSDRRKIVMDIIETDQSFNILADVPGIPKESIHVDVDTDESTLTIAAGSAPDPQSPPPPQPDTPDTHRSVPVTNAPQQDVPPTAAAQGDKSAVDKPAAGEAAQAKHKLLCHERRRPFAERVVTLPPSADLARTTVQYSCGTLHAAVPKRALPNPTRRINIE